MPVDIELMHRCLFNSPTIRYVRIACRKIVLRTSVPRIIMRGIAWEGSKNISSRGRAGGSGDVSYAWSVGAKPP